MAGTSAASEGGMPLSESRWPGPLATEEIGLADYVDRVLQRNESLQPLLRNGGVAVTMAGTSAWP